VVVAHAAIVPMITAAADVSAMRTTADAAADATDDGMVK